jgi:CubicO group peptidase (beta-lactamase class C family)
MRKGGSLDGTRILSPLAVKLMSTNQVGELHSATGLGFGLGFESVDRFGASGMSGEGAFGWGGAYGSLYRVDPEARLVMSLMIQLMPNATDIREVFPTLIYQALK